jgi:predicted MFS family arabinose efflux permease
VLGSQIGARFGWRPAFFVAGGPGLALAFALLLLREPPRGRFDQESKPAASLRQTMQALRSRPSFFFNMAGQTIFTFAMGGLGTWMPTYFVRERGLGVGAAGTVFGALLLVAGFLGTITGGQLGDRLARRFPAPTSVSRAGRSSPRSPSPWRRYSRPPLPFSGQPCSSPCCSPSSTWDRSTPPW